jgi:hypothetical protein
MSFDVKFPVWAPTPEPPPPPEADPHRIEAMVNDFIAAKQDALFDAPEAFYRRTGVDAVYGAPPLLDRLTALRQSMLDQARHDGERALLGPRLDLHVDDARDGIDRHVTKQRDVFARQVIGERQALIRRAAELEHTNDDKLAALAEAHASTAEELARMNGEPGQPAAERARSAIWRTALDRRLANGDGVPALALFDRIKGRLTPDDRRALDGQIAPVALDTATDAWIAREDARPGEPLDARAAADPALSPLERATVMAKVAVRDSHRESRRVATVMGTDDRLADAIRAIGTAPATYKPYTIAALVRTYEEAGEPEKAASTRQLALLESALLPFARSRANRQQRFIDDLPEGDPFRATVETIQRHQAEAFAKDAYAAGTALYPHVGEPVPIDDIAGRVKQARTIAAMRGIPVAPFTADEITTIRRVLAERRPREREAVLARLALPRDMEAQFVASMAPEVAPTDQQGEVQSEPEVGSRSDTSAETMTPSATPTPLLSLPVNDRVWTDGRLPKSGDPNLIAAADEADVEVAQVPSRTNPSGKPQTPTTNAPRPGAAPTKPAPSPSTNPAQLHRAQQGAANRKEIDRLAGKPASDYRSEKPFPADWEKRLPQATLDAVNREAKAFKVPPELLARIMWKESKFEERAGETEGHLGQGIAGISNRWAAEQLWKNWREAAQRDPNNGTKWGELEMAARRSLGNMRLEAVPAVRMAAEYLRYLYDKTGQSWPVAVAAYKHGETVIGALLDGKTTPKSVPEWGQVQAYLGIVFDRDAKRFDAYK